MSAGRAERGTTHCMSPAFCTKQKDLGSNLSPSPDTSTFDLCLIGKKEGKVSHLSSNDDPHRLRCGSCTLQHGRGFLRLGMCHFLTRAAVGILWSQVPVQGLASVTSWAFNVRPTRTGALQKGRRRKEQVRTCSAVAGRGVCYP